MKTYLISYHDHRGDQHTVECSSFEDAEHIAQFIADWYGKANLYDGEFDRPFKKGS